MGYMRHHAIIVTDQDARAERLHAKAVEIFGDRVTALLPPAVNGYRTFLIGPDGSKEGWPESRQGDDARAKFREWLTADPDLWPSWAEVQYGDDEGDDRVLYPHAQPDQR